MRIPRHTILVFLGIGVASLGACAEHTYVPGPGMSAAELGPDSARCRLFAEGTRPDTSFEVQGSARDVAIGSAVMLGVGAIATAVHDNETFNNCMQARGWLVADNAAGSNATRPVAMAGAVPQPVTQSTLPPPVADPPSMASRPVDDARALQAARAQQTAQAWLVAQGILNGPDTVQRHGLYTALCDGGDQSACVMASVR